MSLDTPDLPPDLPPDFGTGSPVGPGDQPPFGGSDVPFPGAQDMHQDMSQAMPRDMQRGASGGGVPATLVGGRAAGRSSGKPGADLSSFVFGKLPPQARELEEAVLGAMLIDKDAVSMAIDILKAESFYVDAHKLIYTSICKLFEESKPVDILTVTQELRLAGELEAAGGAFYVTDLSNRVTSAANIEFHARIVSQKYIQRELIRISTDIIRESYEDTTDVLELLDRSEQNLFSVADQNLRRRYDDMRTLISKAISEIEEVRNREDQLTGIPSGFIELDRVTAGWQRSDLIIVAARPGMGKTAFTLALARNAAVDHGRGIAIFSLEMSSVQLVKRLISMETELTGDKIKKGNLADHEWMQLTKMTGKLAEAPIFIDDTPAINIFELRAKCRRLKMEHDIQMIVIDYLQLMSGTPNGKSGNREQEISTISRSLKGIAKELEIPVIALSQLSRAVETRGGDKRPQLSDLRECLTSDAEILLADQQEPVKIAELLGQKGFRVKAVDENSGTLVDATCTDLWPTGEKEVYRLKTASGRSVIASLNHPFYTREGWTQLVDLKEDDLIAVRSPAPKPYRLAGQHLSVIRENSPQQETAENSEGKRYQAQLRTSMVEESLPVKPPLGFYWDSVLSIEHVGRQMTYDLHIEQHHNFVANDILVHNSGAIEQDADMVIFLYRPEYYGLMEDENGNPAQGMAEIMISKHRNGALENIRVRFIAKFAKFVDMEMTSFDPGLGGGGGGGGAGGFSPLSQHLEDPAQGIIKRSSRMDELGGDSTLDNPDSPDSPFGPGPDDEMPF